MDNLKKIKREYYKELNRKAKIIALNLSNKKSSTPILVECIRELYSSAKLEREFKDEFFEIAYHAPISSELEFVLARVLYHISAIKKLGWKIYLRRQVSKTAPDIRIDKKGKTIAIIEVKAKAGWIQPFFNSDRAQKDILKMKNNAKAYDPRELIKKVKSQLDKYVETFGINRQQIYVFLPTLKLVHRSKSGRTLKDYLVDFAKNSGLKGNNLILLSKNLNLDLSTSIVGDKDDYTNSFESFIFKIAK